ncbi:hypothetical protein EV702DRAFT_1138877 [Suillus placidus]|uniref:Uncharacterized protein n=1 Tax=Suillus placidus TaxID=48579 RepID=A0A9P7CXF0_9AGAM|nr:hypothetical protein EV702DRAFT_1138877 [Suillus placidus]
MLSVASYGSYLWVFGPRQLSVFMSSNESDDVKPNILLLNGATIRPVPPPSRPFHMVVAPGRAREVPHTPREVKPALDIQFPLPPYRQTPGPIKMSQTYLQTLVLERWDAEIRLCDESCRAQLSEHIQGPVAHQNLVREVIRVRWNVAAHGITTRVDRLYFQRYSGQSPYYELRP